MNKTLLIILLIVVSNCNCVILKKRKNVVQLKEKFKIAKQDTILRRVNIPLGELEKFSLNLFLLEKKKDSNTYKANVLFIYTLQRKPQKLYFLLCNEINSMNYTPIDTPFLFTNGGEYVLKVGRKDLKQKSIILFLEGWAGYLYK